MLIFCVPLDFFSQEVEQPHYVSIQDEESSGRSEVAAQDGTECWNTPKEEHEVKNEEFGISCNFPADSEVSLRILRSVLVHPVVSV